MLRGSKACLARLIPSRLPLASSSQIAPEKFLTQTFRLPTLGKDYKLRVTERVQRRIEAVGIERYLLNERRSGVLGPTGLRLRNELLAQAGTFSQAHRRAAPFKPQVEAAEPVQPSATLIWHRIELMKEYDERLDGYCLHCCCSGHTTSICHANDIEGEEAFYDLHANSKGKGRPICFSFHLTGLCTDADCIVGACVACGDRHPTFEHFNHRARRPRLPDDLPPLQPKPTLDTRSQDVADIMQQEVDRAKHLDAQGRLLQRKYFRRAEEEKAAYEAWEAAGSPHLDHLASRYAIFDSAASARAAVMRPVPHELHQELKLQKFARERERRRAEKAARM